MEKGLRALYTGDFNSCSSEEQSNDSVIIILSKRGKGETYRFKVKDLYGKNEKVLEHEVIDSTEEQKKKPWIAERMKKAKEEKEKEDNENG